MPEKCADSGPRARRSPAAFAALPRFYVAAFIFACGQSALWIALTAVQRLARYVLMDKWPDVAGYTYAETSRGLGVKIQISRVRFSAFHSNSREAH